MRRPRVTVRREGLELYTAVAYYYNVCYYSIVSITLLSLITKDREYRDIHVLFPVNNIIYTVVAIIYWTHYSLWDPTI